MIRLFIRHRVGDYPSWRKEYDAFDAERRSLGVVGDAVYQKVGDANEVTVWHDFETAEAAEALMTSGPLRDAMAAGGVVGQPEMWVTTEA